MKGLAFKETVMQHWLGGATQKFSSDQVYKGQMTTAKGL